MGDSSVKKVEAKHSPRGRMGQRYLVSGKRVAMRLWQEPAGARSDPIAREYETVGYAIDGHARLELEGQTLELRAGDSWLVPASAEHSYLVVEDFEAVEATSPPAHAHARDEVGA